MNWICLFLCLVLLACEPTERPVLLAADTDTRMLTVQSSLSPEEQARLDKIANRTLLQQVVDKAPASQLQTIDFACSAQSGGVFTQVYKGRQLRGFRLSLAQEQRGRSTRWYYKCKAGTAPKVVLVAHEQSTWQEEQERIEQTVFYKDGSDFLQILHRRIKVHPDRLEKVLDTTSFEVLSATAATELWAQLQTEEEYLSSTERNTNYESYFCP